MNALRNTVYGTISACVLLLIGGMISCRDAITTNDPRTEIVTTKVAVQVVITPMSPSNLGITNNALITVSVHDTNQNNSVEILSALITGRDGADFTIVENISFPLQINARDSAVFHLRFSSPVDTGNVVASLALVADSGNINVSAPLNYSRSDQFEKLATNTVSLDFGSIAVDTNINPVNLAITNTGSMAIQNVNVTPVREISAFLYNPSLPYKASLAAAANFQIAVQFHPTAPGFYIDTLVITGDTIQPPLYVVVTGTGIMNGNNGVLITPDPILFTDNIQDDTASVYAQNTNSFAVSIDSIVIQQGTDTNFSIWGDGSGPNQTAHTVAGSTSGVFLATVTSTGDKMGHFTHTGSLIVYFQDGSQRVIPLNTQ